MTEDEKQKPSLESLFLDFDHPNPHINKNAYEKMARFWPNKAMEKLLKDLDHPDLIIRRKTVKALGCFDKDVYHPLVITYQERKTKEILVSCMKVLVKVACKDKNLPFPDEVMNLIKIAIEDDIPELILTVVPLLKLLGKQGLPILVKCLEDSNVLKSSAAATALSEMKYPKVQTHLESLLVNNRLDPIVQSSLKASFEKL